MPMAFLTRVPSLLLMPLLLTSCLMGHADGGSPPPRTTEYRAFGSPQRVAIHGYDGHAMEPFITKDGQYLLFNNRNDPRTNTNLHLATRVDDLRFQYQGELKGANTPALDAVPSLDRDGHLFFISVRSYEQTLSTLYQGRFDKGKVTGVELVEGVSLRKPGVVMFDAEIATDGKTLLVVDGQFTGGPAPKTADIAIAVRDGTGFRRTPASSEQFKNINTKALEYAPAISGDLLELFFTRASTASASHQPVIMRATRSSPEEAFGLPQKVAAITGFVEAPTLTADGRALYYHRLDGDRYVLYRVAR
ncbi:MAG: PD40 domain-containing protein [Vitreoscilla sp.]|nr:PD40 domain-containing protein [Vitreoscilla sp.]MBP6675765.1 PD40 domain-containing protein [Vitreoscilla sp.]